MQSKHRPPERIASARKGTYLRRLFLSRRCTKVLASVLGVDLVEIVRAWPDVVDGTFRCVVPSIMVLLAKLRRSRVRNEYYVIKKKSDVQEGHPQILEEAQL